MTNAAGEQNSTRAFPWDDAIAAGLGVLCLAPRDFWSMTPRELSLALRGAAGLSASEEAFARGDLAALMQRFPDMQINSLSNGDR